MRLLRNINWKDHFISFIVVIVGIYIAFKLNSYSEEASRQKILQDHMEYIRDETVLNRINLEYIIADTDSLLKSIDLLIEHLRSDGDLAEIHRLTFDIISYQYVYLKKNAFSTLTESGDIRYIKDYRLKTNTIRMYEYYNWTKVMEENAGSVLSEQYFPYLRKHMDLLNGDVQPRDVYFEKEYMNTIVSYRFSVSLMLEKYKDCLREVDGFLELLAENGFEVEEK